MRALGWALILLGLLLLWPFGGVLALVVSLTLLVLGLVLAPLALVLTLVLLPLVLVLAIGAALLKVLWPALLIALGLWLLARRGTQDAA